MQEENDLLPFSSQVFGTSNDQGRSELIDLRAGTWLCIQNVPVRGAKSKDRLPPAGSIGFVFDTPSWAFGGI